MLGSLLVGSVPNIVIGSYTSVQVPERLLRAVLAVALTAVAVKTVLERRTASSRARWTRTV